MSSKTRLLQGARCRRALSCPKATAASGQAAKAADVALDLAFVRAQFPAFSAPALQGQAFFGNAGGSYTCAPVLDRLSRFYHERKVQPYGPYTASRLGGEEMDEARSRLAARLHLSESELSFGPSTTQNIYVLAQAFGEWLAPGDAIVVTNQDHEANSGPWRRLQQQKGIDVREWKLDKQTGHLDPADLANLLDDRVRLVCFPHCSNVVAEINPVKDITAMAHKAGALVCVDGVSYAPHGLPDLEDLGCDIYLFSAYKTYGPHQGLMAIREPVAQMLPNQAHFFNDKPLYKRFTPAGPDHAQIAASAGMTDYFDALEAHHGGGVSANELMRGREITLTGRLLDWIRSREELRLIGPDDPAARAPTVAVALKHPAAPVAAGLAEYGLMVEGGHFYAKRALDAIGVDPDAVGVLRFSFLHYTSDAEMDQLLGALDAVL